MATGIKSSPECIDLFNLLKLRKSFRYIVYHINDEKQIEVMKKASRDATYKDLKDDLLEAMDHGEGRYVVFDHEDANKNDSLVFILWTPSTSTVRNKMLYAGSKDALRTKLLGIKNTIEATEIGDLEMLETQ